MELSTGLQNFGATRDGMHMRTEFSEVIADMRDVTYSLSDGIRAKSYEISMWE